MSESTDKYIASDYTCYDVDLTSDINFSWFIMLVDSTSGLHTNQIYKLNVVM